MAYAFRHVDQQDWDWLLGRIAGLGHGRFWEAVFAEARSALANTPSDAREAQREGDGTVASGTSEARKFLVEITPQTHWHGAPENTVELVKEALDDLFWKKTITVQALRSEPQREGLAGRLAELREACAKVAEQEALDFLSPEYATGQPLSSFAERFACEQVAKAIRSLDISDERGA